MPELCDWLHSVDDVLWGRLLAVRAVTDTFTFPFSGREHELVTEGSCKVLDPALDLEVEVESSARGSFARGESVTARLGRYQWDYWTTQPELVMGHLRWRGDERLEAGQWIGLAVHWVEEHSMWSLLGEPLLYSPDAAEMGPLAPLSHQIGADDECRAPRSPDLDGHTIESLSALQQSCESTDAADERREASWRSWGNRPANFIAGVCHDSDGNSGPPVDGCVSDGECPPGTLCTDGSCQ